MTEEINGLIGGNISLEDGIRLQQLISGRLSDSSPQQVNDLAAVIEQAYRCYCIQFPLSSADTQKIAADAGIKLLTCAALIARHAPKVALSIMGRALKISPVAPIQFAQKAAKNLLERHASVE